MLCACVVPCVRVLCALALRVHTRGYTHLISANGFGCDARGKRNSSSFVKFAARGGRPPMDTGSQTPGGAGTKDDTGAVFTLRTAPSRCRRLLMRCASSSPTISVCGD